MQAGGEVAVGPLLTVKEAADRLKVSTATVYALCEARKLAFSRVSTHAIRITLSDLESFVGRRHKQRVAARGDAPGQ